jgi:hypothetical protein
VERRLAAIRAADVGICPRLVGGVTPVRWRNPQSWCMRFAKARRGSSPISAYLFGSVIEVTAVPLSPQAHRIIAEYPDLVPPLASAGDDYEVVFTSPPDASLAIECLSPELALLITATGPIERKAGVWLVDADRKRAPITASAWQRS